MQQIVTNAILAKGYEGWGSHHYVVNVLLSMRSALLQREWNEKPTNEFLPFRNKVLEIATGKLRSHSQLQVQASGT